MFTGLIQSTGVYHSRTLSGKAGKLRVRTARTFPDLRMGESIAVNGVCLTLERDLGGNLLEFHVMEESFRRTNLGSLKPGGVVNLERALAVGDRLGGHIVSGHVDGTGTVLSLGKNGDDTELKVAVSPAIREQMVPKGSIAIDGISLTVAALGEDCFSVCIIPTTWRETNLAACAKGDVLNLETDMLGKYVLNMLRRMNPSQKSSVTMNLLREAGFLES